MAMIEGCSLDREVRAERLERLITPRKDSWKMV